MSILKELPTLEGSVEIKGQMAYVSQQPWVFSASLRQNITFGSKYVKTKYERILKACALNKVKYMYVPRCEKTFLQGFANNKSVDQPAHLRRLISAFVIHLLESIISKLATSEISIF